MNVKRVNRIVSILFEEMKMFSDEDRDLPVKWSVMHMYSSSQLAKLIALRRGMDAEFAALAAALHDITVIMTGKSEGHAEKAVRYVRDAIEHYNNGPWTKLPKITKDEEDLLIYIITKHSEKTIFSDDPLVELLKDVDSLDRYLHGIKTDGAYLERCNRVLLELGIAAVDEGSDIQ
jgi:uncharacterized protein